MKQPFLISSLIGEFNSFSFQSYDVNDANSRLSGSQSKILADIKIVYLFECFKFFYDKLSFKFYEFCHLTYSVKKPLPPKVEEQLESVVQHCLGKILSSVLTYPYLFSL